MNRLHSLRERNPALRIETTAHPSFATYGRTVWHDYVPVLAEYLSSATPMPDSGSIYAASDAGAEALGGFAEAAAKFYGGLPVQQGYCNGVCRGLDALEYHMGSEILVAATDLVLLLADARDFYESGSLHSSQVEAFYLAAGQAVELFGQTMHYAPCAVDGEGFRAGIMLPRDTNTALAESSQDPLLTARNKWLIAHHECAQLREQGALPLLYGDMLEVEGL